MERKKSLKVLSLVLVMLLVLSACSGGTAPKTPSASGNQSGQQNGTKESDVIKFGVYGPMTGDSAMWGEHLKRGVEFAVEEINAAGGVNGKKLEYIVGDDQGNPNQSTIIAEKFATNDELLFVIGSVGSGCTLAALPIFQKAGIMNISGSSTNTQLTKLGYENFFRIIVNDDEASRQQALIAIKEFDAKKPALLWENSDYGIGVRDVWMKTFEEFGIEPVASESYVAGVDRDFSSQATKFKGAGADVVLTVGDYTAAALFAKQNHSLGLNAQIVACRGAASNQIIEIGGQDVEGVVMIAGYDPNDPEPIRAEFTKKFTAKYGEAPTEWSSHGYDAINIVKLAIEAGGTTRETLIEKMHDVEYQGVTGYTKFDETGDIVGKFVGILKVEDGQLLTYIPKNL